MEISIFVLFYVAPFISALLLTWPYVKTVFRINAPLYVNGSQLFPVLLANILLGAWFYHGLSQFSPSAAELLLFYLLPGLFIIVFSRHMVRFNMRVNPLFYPPGSELIYTILFSLVGGLWVIRGVVNFLAQQSKTVF